MATKRKRKSSGGTKRKTSRAKRGTTTALARVTTTAPARRAPRAITRRAPAAVGRPRRRRSGGGGGMLASVGHTYAGGVFAGLKRQAPYYAGSALYGWATGADAGTNRYAGDSWAGKVHSLVAKVPTITAIGRPATHGLLAALVASKTKGRIRQFFDVVSVAALHRSAYNLGVKNFSRDTWQLVEGDDDVSGDFDDDVSGDDDDVGADDDELRGDDDEL